MVRFLTSAPRRLARWARRRPLDSLVLVLAVLAAATAGGVYAHAVRQWHRAQAAVAAGRPDDARAPLETCLAVWPRDPRVLRLAARAARLSGDYATAEARLNACLRIEHGASEDTQLEFLLMRAQRGEVDEVAALLIGYVDRRHPDSQIVLQTLALTYMYNLRYGPAYATLVRWVKEFPDDARGYHFRGWVLERLNQPKAALEDYTRALDLDPDLDKVRLRVAEMYLEDKEPQSARPHLDRLRAKSPDQPEVLARLGQCRFLEGQHPEARALLERAVERLPDDPQVLLYLGRLDMEDGQPARAEGRLRRALAKDASDTEIRYALMTSLQLQGKEKEAAAEQAEYDRHKAVLERANHLLQEEARRPSRDPGPASEIGTLLLQIGQDRLGLYWMDEALARDPEHQPTRRALVEYFEKRGDPERAAVHRKHLHESGGGS